MNEYHKYKGNTYEEYVLHNLLNDYDNVYFFKDTPENIISKTKLYNNLILELNIRTVILAPF